ncbi:hypothetical protein [Sphingomonas phyllosphaerae]|uniref:hypothetical protein n=1 Tax=Sphingomonas phyllosphaerae TaxID=257003 RepID=UPI000565CC11|nr:hypothetical protein [Sphingomonas phyllosphaerae]
MILSGIVLAGSGGDAGRDDRWVEHPPPLCHALLAPDLRDAGDPSMTILRQITETMLAGRPVVRQNMLLFQEGIPWFDYSRRR